MRRKTPFLLALTLVSVLFLILTDRQKPLVAQAQQGAAPAQTPAPKTQIAPDDTVTPRTMEGYVEQVKPFYDNMLKNHPMF